SILRNTLQVFDYNIPVYKFLQHGSTFVGVIAIVIYMSYRAAKYKRNQGRGTGPVQKLMYWGLVSLLSILLFVAWHFIHSMPIELYGVIVVRMIDSVLVSLLIVSLSFSYIYGHKKRPI